MKLKSILIMAMVAIMAMAGGAFAATSTVTTSTNTDVGGTLFGHSINIFGCTSVVGAVTACAAMSPAAALTFVNQTTGGSGTGLVGGMPPQVAYSAVTGLYVPGTADATTGYLLNQNLYGMCGVGGCPLFVPLNAITQVGIGTMAQLLFATGGGVAGTFLNSASTIPANTGAFDQAIFTTGLVSGFSDTLAGGSGMINEISQFTQHQSANGDFIDQRLAFTVVGANTVAPGSPSGVMNQAVAIAGGPGTTAVDTGLVDATWKGNVDAFFTFDPSNNSPGAQFYFNTAAISQQIGDNNAGSTNGVDIGSYGQVFNNTVTVTNALAAPGLPNAPQVLYVPATGPSIPLSLP